MKCYKRFFSLFLCLVLFCGLFSVTAHADTVETSTFKVNILSTLDFGGNLGQYNLNNGESGYNAKSLNILWENKQYLYRNQLTFADSQGAAIFKGGKTYTFFVDNLYSMIGVSASTTDLSTVVFTKEGGFSIYWAWFRYADGTESSNFNSSFTYTQDPVSGTYSLKGTFTPEKDVSKVIFYLDSYFRPSEFNQNLIGKTSNFSAYYGTFPQNENPMKLEISVQSEEAGLLAGLLGWVQNIFDKVEESWEVLSAGFANVVKGITELPQKLWSAIETGLKNLFVPDDQYMTTYKDKWDQLLSSRLGAVYEVCSIVTESWDNVMNADNTNTISIPTVTIPIANSSFSFGGYDVKIVPEGFGVLVDALKLIVGIVCTYCFVNGLLKRYDEVMGVEK